MEQAEKRTNTFAALGAGAKKKTAPPTVLNQPPRINDNFFSRAKHVVEGAWADDSGDEEVLPAPKGKIIDADGFEVVKGKKGRVPVLMVEPEPEPEIEEEEETEEESSSEEEDQEEEESKPTVPAPKSKEPEKQLSKKEKKKQEEEELNALLKELAEQTSKETPSSSAKEATPAQVDAAEGGAAIAEKKKKKKPAKKKEGEKAPTGESVAAKSLEGAKKPVKKEAPKKSAVELAVLKEAKEREEKMKKKTRVKKLDFDPIH